MIRAERSFDVAAVAELVYPDCVAEAVRLAPGLVLTMGAVQAVVAAWTLVVFRDTQDGVVVGAVACQPDGFVHIIVRPEWRARWNPRTALRLALDVFLAEHEVIYADIPRENLPPARLARKLGFSCYEERPDLLRFRLARADRRW